MIDSLIKKIIDKKCPIFVGLDTMHTYLPKTFNIDSNASLEDMAEGIFKFNKGIIDAVLDIVPSVKVQVAYYEMYGCPGMEAFLNTISYAKEKGLVVIADVKRGDIGSTAEAYSCAYLSGINIKDKIVVPFEADFITVNAYLGSDGIMPFIKVCKENNKGIFILVKTSNPSSCEFQDLDCNGKKLYEHIADKVSVWGDNLIGKYGYSSVGAVVGATYKGQAQSLRDRYKNMFFLIPGYGAQGATAEDVIVNFDKNGLGGVVNSSRGILLAYRKGDIDYQEAAYRAANSMKHDILNSFSKRGIEY